MTKRAKAIPAIAAAAALLAIAAPTAEAQVVRVDDGRQSVGFNIGYFAVRPEDGRTDGDVLVADLSSSEALLFDIDDFNGATFGGEWTFAVSDFIEVGAGLGYYQRTVPSIYADFQNENGSEIEQDLKLRVVPISATVRFLPIGRGGIQPYVGGGIGIFPWRYSETGEFIDTNDFSIFRRSYVADGTAVGGIVLGGIRFPVGDVWAVGGELRYQAAKGDIDQAETDLLGDKIDLGGWSTSFTVNLRF
jgi:hypothetical protein